MAALTASFITPSARHWLATTQSARLLSNFDRACNLVNENGAVLALVTSDRGLTPFGLVVSSPDPAPFKTLQPQSTISLLGSQLVVGDLTIETNTATDWNPSPDWASLRALFSTQPEKLLALAGLALENAPEGSLLDLYLPEANRSQTIVSKALLERVHDGGLKLLAGLNTNDAHLCVDGANAMAGLGGGLTPAGDDFIVGVGLAVWAGLHGAGKQELLQSIVEAAASRTTILSAAYMKAAGQGECISHWHRLFESLYQDDVDVIGEAARTLMSIGHTSGADGLAGFLAVELLGG